MPKRLLLELGLSVVVAGGFDLESQRNAGLAALIEDLEAILLFFLHLERHDDEADKHVEHDEGHDEQEGHQEENRYRHADVACLRQNLL